MKMEGETETESTKSAESDQELLAPISRRMRIITTIAIFYGNIAYGCATNAFSPALTDFKTKFETDTSTISVVFVIIVGSYMVGALLCTVIYNIINRQLAVILLFLGMTMCMVVAPHIPNLGTFYTVGAVLGFCSGCYDAAQFVWIMEMWQQDSGPHVQAQHFCFAVGTVLNPLLMSPFLSNDDGVDDTKNIVNDTTGIIITKDISSDESDILVPFTILGILCAISAVIQILLFIFLRYQPPKIRKVSMASAEETSEQNLSIVSCIKQQWPGWSVARLIILSALTLGTYVGMEMCTLQLFPTFGQNSDVHLSESGAADTLTGLTVAYMVGRGISIVLIFKISPLILVAVDAVIILAGNVLLVLWGNSSKDFIWAAGILYGLGFSSLLPSFCVYMERYMEFTNTIGAIMLVTGSFVGSMYPLIVGSSVEENALVFTYPIFASLSIIFCSVTVVYFSTRNSRKRGHSE